MVGGWGCRRCTRRGACPVGWRLTLPPLSPAGACPLCRLPPLPFRHPQGGLPFSSPAYPAFGLLSCPLFPRPPSPVGKGETKVISCKGLRPLHPRAEPKRRWEQGRTTHPAGACPAGRRLTLPPLYPAEGVLSLSPPCPAFSLLSCPLSPQPALAERSSPAGKGEIFSFLMQGASPLASPELNLWFAAKTAGSVFP